MPRPPDARDDDGFADHRGSIEAERFDIFQWLTPEVRDAFIQASRTRRISAGTIIYVQDDVGREMYRILSGDVRLSHLTQDGRELVYSLFGPPATFGFSTLIDGKGLPHTAIAQRDVELQVLSLAAFVELRQKYRAFDEALLQAMCGHMRTLSIYMGDAAIENLMRRAARRLFDLTTAGEGNPSVIHLSQAEIASMLGASRQSMNKLLRQFEDLGLLTIRYGTVVVHDADGLRVLAEQ